MSPKQDCRCKFIDTIPLSGSSSLIQSNSGPINSSSLIQTSAQLNKNLAQIRVNPLSKKQLQAPQFPNFDNINRLQYGVNNLANRFTANNLPIQIQSPLNLARYNNYQPIPPRYNTYQPIPQFTNNYQSDVKRKLLEKLLMDDLASQPTTQLPYFLNNQFYPYTG